ncbi:MAG TPA: rhodanese-like domain-containing protein [Chloroflexota bacterium]|nr:rhodanese-like domain-containing protein [Chloroflexota bacterium]
MGIFSWLFGPEVETIEVTDVQRLQAEGAVVIDVREPHEWAMGHVQGAKLMPLGSLNRELSKIRSDRQVLFICQSGHRGARATDMANRRGLKAVNVRGGMMRWMRAGLPVKNGRK